VGEVLRDHRLPHTVRTEQDQVLRGAVLEEAELEELLDLPSMDLLRVTMGCSGDQVTGLWD